MKKKIERPERDKDRDLIRQQWPKLSLNKKIKYIFFYYGTAIIIMIFAVTVMLFLIGDIRKQKMDEAFYVMAIDLDLPDDKAEMMEQELSGVSFRLFDQRDLRTLMFQGVLRSLCVARTDLV